MFTPLNTRERGVIARHLAEASPEPGAPPAEGVRVRQDERRWSTYRQGKLWVHDDTPRKNGVQELVFYASTQTVPIGTLTASHALKWWDLGRYATARELARLQGFPESFHVPTTCVARLFGNAVAVPCAAHACSRLVDDDEGPLTFVDVCSGIGGFHHGMVRACPRARCVGFSEIAPAAIACYRDNFPDAPALGDALARDTTWPACDVVLAGFPCQPFSRNSHDANKRASHVHRDFFEGVLRVLDVTGATRVVLENVPTLPRNGPEQWQGLCEGLARLGFVVEHAVLDAADFGVAQTRRRLYMVGRRDGGVVRPFAPPGTRGVVGDVVERLG